MKINLNAGHGLSSKGGAIGAVGIFNESEMNRQVVFHLKDALLGMGHRVADYTVDSGTASEIINSIVSQMNNDKADLNISIHFNAFDGSASGTECLVYSTTSQAYPYAVDIVNKIADLGFNNRGVKIRTDLGVLRSTSQPTVLVECCFCDSARDVSQFYTTEGAMGMADAIAEAIDPVGFKGWTEYQGETSGYDEEVDEEYVVNDPELNFAQSPKEEVEVENESTPDKPEIVGYEIVAYGSRSASMCNTILKTLPSVDDWRPYVKHNIEHDVYSVRYTLLKDKEKADRYLTNLRNINEMRNSYVNTIYM